MSDGAELDKVDFKTSVALDQRSALAQLAKLISAIANTDSEELDNYGYVNRHLEPPVRFDIRSYSDPSAGWFGALVIRPRLVIDGPHFIGKEFNDGRVVIVSGACFVRVGEETKQAQRRDYERMYQAKYSVAFDRLLESDRTDRPDLQLYFVEQGNYVAKVSRRPHCCPVKSRIESIGWGHRGIRLGSRMAGVPVKGAFFRIA